ncbi:MAG: phage tail tape measure protein [Bacteroidota bacterium]
MPLAQDDTLLELKVGFRTKEATAAFVRDFQKAEATARKRAQQGATKDQQQANQRARKAAEELAQRRRQLAVETIKDETRRRKLQIEELYRAESRRIKLLLKERVEAGEISAAKAEQQFRNFDTQLRTRRDQQLAAVPQQTLFNRLGGGAALAGAGIVAGVAVQRGLERSIALAIGFEEQLVEVRKTTGLTREETDALGADLLDLAAELGAPQDGLAEIAATAGQLGIQGRDNILAFTETVAKFAGVTDLSASEAAQALATVSNAFRLDIAAGGVDALGSALNELSNTTAASAGAIVDAVSKVGAVGLQAGLTADQVAAITATLIDAGVAVETAGVSTRNVLTIVQTEAEQVAEVLGITASEFLAAFGEDPIGTLRRYLLALRELPPALRTIEIEKVFGRENTVAVATLADQVDRLEVNLDRSATAFRQATSLNQEYATSLESASAQWAIFTARITKAATALGQQFLPAITSVLRFLNQGTLSAADFAEEYGRLRAEIGQTRELDRLLDRYETLIENTELSEEETAELRRVTDQLAAAYPGYVRETNAAGVAVGLFSDQLRIAVNLQRELKEAAAQESLGGFIEEYRDVTNQIKGASAEAERFASLATDAAALQESNRSRRRGSFSPGGFVPASQSFEDLSQQDALDRQEAAVQRGTALQDEQRVAILRLAQAQDAAGLNYQQLGAELEAANVPLRERIAILDALAQTRRRLSQTETTTVVDGGDDEDGGSGSSTSETERAFERLVERQRELQAERISDDEAREIASIEARYQREREEIERTVAKAREQRPDLASSIDETEAGSLAAIAEIEAREVQRVRDEAAAERLRKEQETQATLLKLSAARADAESATEAARQRVRVALIEDEAERVLALAELEFAEKTRLARAAFVLEQRLISISEASEEEKLGRLQAARAAFNQALQEADLSRIEATADAERDAAQEAERLYEDRVRQVRRFTDIIIGNLVNLFRTEQGLSEAQVALRRASLEEETRTLEEQLSQRAITYADYQRERQRIALETAEFERQVEADKFSFFEATSGALLDLALSAGAELLSEFIAQQLARLTLTQTTTAAATTAQVAAATTIASAYAPAAAAASIATFGAAAGAGTAAAVAGTTTYAALIKSLSAAAAGFAEGGVVLPRSALLPRGGGYTGAGPRHESAGFGLVEYHRGEVVMEKAIVDGQLREWMMLRQLAQRGLRLSDLLRSAGLSYEGGGEVSALASVVVPPVRLAAASVSTDETAAEVHALRLGLAARDRVLQEQGRQLARQGDEIARLKAQPAPVVVDPRTARDINRQGTRYATTKRGNP